MADSKDRFESNPLGCQNHEDEIVYRAHHEDVHQCTSCGCGYVHNLNTGEYYG